MALFVLGDPHLSFSTDKPMDIFGKRWENHAARIREQWIHTVKPSDTVVLAGDISWAMTLEEAKADLFFLHQLPGRKVLLKGNHDYWWQTARKMTLFFEENGWEDFFCLYNTAIEADGFALCGTRGWNTDNDTPEDRKILAREVQRLELSLQAAPEGLERVVFFHYPPVGSGESPFLPILQKYGVRRCYYGHLHGARALETPPFEREGIRFTLISADALQFAPLPVLKEKKGENHQNGQKKALFLAKLLSHFRRKC